MKFLKSRLDSSIIFYNVLRVVKMTSMARFNDIMKHVRVRDYSLRIPLRLLCFSPPKDSNLSCLGIFTNTGKCGSININVSECIFSMISSIGRLYTYGKKGYVLCGELNQFKNTIHEVGSTSARNFLISSRLLSFFEDVDDSIYVLYNRYVSMSTRCVAHYLVPSYSGFLAFCTNPRVVHKLGSVSNLSHLYDFLVASLILNALVENDLSECSARIQSLEIALKNLELIVEDLKKSYNRKRQGSITNELLEIIASTTAI